MTPLVQQAPVAPIARPATPAPIKRFLDYLFVECGLAGNTVSAYQSDLREFWADVSLDNHLPAGLSIEDVQQHLIALHERGLLSARSRR